MVKPLSSAFTAENRNINLINGPDISCLLKSTGHRRNILDENHQLMDEGITIFLITIKFCLKVKQSNI